MSQIVPYLFFLACPVSMAIMMWFMMPGMGSHATNEHAAEQRVAQLALEVEALRVRQSDPEPVRTH